MQIYDILAKDHEKLKELLNDLVSLNEGDDDYRKDLIADIRNELVPHARAEESIFYNSLRALDESKEAMHGYGEHVAAEGLLRTLQVADKVDIGWKATAEKLKDAIEHHIQEEEDEIFAAAREVFSDEEAEMMGQAFERMKPQIEEEGFMKNTFDMVANMMPPRLTNSIRNKFGSSSPTTSV